MAETMTCREQVSERDGWHSHRCGNKAKWWVLVHPAPGERRKRPVCGIHVKWHRRFGEVLGPIADGGEGGVGDDNG